MICHKNVIWRLGGWFVSQSILSLAFSMVEPAFIALLVAAVGLAPLLPAAFPPASVTTVGLTAVAARTNEKQCSALFGPTEPLTQRELASIGHRSC